MPSSKWSEEGFFSEQGLDVELVSLKSANDFFPLLLKGDLDAATPSLTPGFSTPWPRQQPENCAAAH